MTPEAQRAMRDEAARLVKESGMAGKLIWDGKEVWATLDELTFDHDGEVKFVPQKVTLPKAHVEAIFGLPTGFLSSQPPFAYGLTDDQYSLAMQAVEEPE